MDATIIDCRSEIQNFRRNRQRLSWSYPSSGNSIVAGLAKDITTITIADTSAFAVGQIIQISFQDQTGRATIMAGAVPIVNVSGFGYNRKQKTRVVAKTATTLTIFPGIYHAPDATFRQK